MSELLGIADLRTYFDTDRGTVKGVDRIDLTIQEGETAGLLGETGSGKSVTAPSAMQIIDDPRYVTGGVLAALETVFALGVLVCGFGTLGWSGSVMAGRGFEAPQEYLDTGTGWTEADSRRAMTRIAGFGAGLMVSAPLIATVA